MRIVGAVIVLWLVAGLTTGAAADTPPDPVWVPTLPTPPVGGTPAFRPDHWPLRPLHPVVLAWWGLLVVAAPRWWAPWLAGLLALGTRLALTSPRILMGVDYAYTRLADGTGLLWSGKLYGGTWTSLQGLVWWVTGGAWDHVHHTNLALSALTVVFAAALVERLAGATAGRWTGVLLALAPLPIALARMETELVLAGCLQVTAGWGVLASGRRGRGLAVASAVLLAHLRPDQIPFAALVAVTLALRGGPGAAALVALGISWRLAELWHDVIGRTGLPTAVGYTQLHRALDPGVLFGPGGTLTVTDPLTSPVAWLPLVGAAAWRAPRTTAALLVPFAATSLPYLHFERVTDVLRFGLPGQTWWVAIAATGLAGLGVGWRGCAIAAVAATTWIARHPLGTPFPWQVEHAVLRRVIRDGPLHEPPRGTVVWFDPAWDRTAAFEHWIALQRAGWWRPWGSGPPAEGDWVWIGRADMYGRATEGCRVEEIGAVEVEVRESDVEGLRGKVKVGVGRCVE